MSKIFCTIAICMSLISLPAKSQQAYELPVICGPLDKNLELIAGYEEKPFFLGKDDFHEQFGVTNLNLAVFVNKIKGTFTVALLSKEQKRFCAISSGKGIDLPNTEVKY